MLNRVNMQLAVFRKVDISHVIGMSSTLVFDRNLDTRFWYDTETSGLGGRPLGAYSRSVSCMMHQSVAMGEVPMLMRIEAHVVTGDWVTARFEMDIGGANAHARNDRAMVVETDEDTGDVTVVWDRIMKEETFTAEVWQERVDNPGPLSPHQLKQQTLHSHPPMIPFGESEITTPHSHQYR